MGAAAAWVAANKAASFAIGTAIAGLGTSVHQGKQAAKDAKHAAALEQAQQAVATRNQRRKQMREARIARAAAAQQMVVRGTQQTSQATGVQASIAGEAGRKISFLNQQSMITKGISAANQRAADHQSRAATASAVSSLAMSSIGLFGGGGGTDTTTPTPEGG